MTDLTNVPVRNINDLELAENIPLDASVLDAVKIPVGGLTQFTQGEALSLKQLREVLVAAMPGWVPSTIDDLIARSDAEVQKMLEKYLNAIKDVSVVLDAIQGQINESHLALELNKKIEIGTLANDIAKRAQETANAAYAAAEDAEKAAIAYAEDRVKEAEQTISQLVLSTEEQINAAKTQAQQLTEQARQDAQALITALDQKFAALNGNINTEISNLNAGLTQETTARQEGLAQITTTLNAYKVVVDDNLAVLFSKNETIVSDAAALATQVNALKSQVALVEGALSLKLDASIIQNYYTKTEAAENATTVAAGEITKYDSQLVIGGVNQLLNSEAERTATPREYLLYENSEHLKDFYDNNLGKDVTVSFDLKVPVAGPVQVYCSNGTHHTFSATVTVAASDVNKWVRHAVTVKPVKKAGAEAVTQSGLEFYGIYDTGRFPSVRKVQLEAGNKATDWSPSPRDTQASLDANATAIQNTDTEVSRVNNEVVSQGQSLTTLQNNLNDTNGEVAKKADATVVDGVTSRVTATETGLTSVGNRTTALENSVNHETTGLSTKASTSALNTTNSNVSAIDGTVKAHTDQLTQLSSDVVTINNGLATKLDSSVINNYYTKAQSDASADTIAAGKIDQFNASLVIGGDNLIAASKSFRVGGAGTGITKEILADGSLKLTGSGATYHSWAAIASQNSIVNIKSGESYTVTLWYKAVDVGNLPTIMPHFYLDDGGNYQNSFTVLGDLSKGGEVRYVQTRTAMANLTALGIPHMHYNSGALGGGLILTKWKVERGTKSTDWTPSSAEVQDTIDANATAISNTNTEVSRVDGKTTVNANNISGLTSRMGIVEGQVTSKLDASVIQNYYTKTEAAENATAAAAGEISKYDANLVIGGSNLLKNSNFEGELGPTNWSTDGSNVWIKVQDAVNGTVLRCVQGSLSHEWVTVDVGTTLVFSALVKTPVDRTMHLTVPLHCWAGKDYASEGKFEVLKKSHDTMPAGVWTKIWVVIELTGDANSFKPFIYDSWPLDGFEVAWTKLERGNKATDWSPSVDDVQSSLDANSAAIQNTNVEVKRVDGKTTANANDITGLTSRIGTVEGQVTSKLDASVIQNYYTKGQADDKSAEIAAGKIESYDANLVIGGTNLMEYTSGNAAIYGAGTTYDAATNSFIKSSGSIYYTAFRLNSFKPKMGEVYTVSGYLYVDEQPANYSNYWTESSTINRYQKSIGEVRVKSDGYFYGTYEVTDASEWNAAHFFYPAGTLLNETQHTLRFKDLQLEKGSKPSAYSKPAYETQKSLSANANAIQTVTAEVARIDGRVTTESNRITTLTGRVDTVADDIAKKADASALNLLTARVESEEGKSTSQGNAITSLKNTIDHATTGLSTRASSEALSSLSTLVEEIEGQVSTSAKSLEKLEIKVDHPLKASGSWKISSPRKTATSASLRSLQIKEDKVLANRIDTLNASLGDSLAQITESFTAEVAVVDGKVSTHASQLLVLTSDNDANKNALAVQAKVIDGVKASYMVKMETNGVIGGFGLMQSTGELGQVVTSFGVNADSFFIGAPASNKKPFIVTTTNQVVNGVTYPAGTYIDVALIANATIGTAKIADLAVTNAKILDATIESAKIKSIQADKIEVGNPLVGPITTAMVTGTSLTNAGNLFNGNIAANAPFATYGTGTRSPTSGAETNYIQIDVGSTVSMPEVRFFFRGSAGRKTYIKLKASTDGVNWDYIMGNASRWETIDDMPPGPGSDYSTVTIQASFSWYGVKPYRYLRLYGNGSSASATNELVAIIGNASGSVTKIGSEGILTNSITADKIKVDSLSAISANLGTIKVDTANIEDLAVDTIKIKDNAVTSLLEVQRTQQRVEQNFSVIPANTLTSIKIKVVLMSGLSKNNRYLVYWRGVIGAGMSSRLSNTPQYLGWARKRVYFGSTSSTGIVGNRILVETNQLNGNYIKWYENNAASTGDVTQWNVAEGIVDETGSLCLWVDVEWKSFADNIPADTFYGYLFTSDLSVLISEFKK